MDIRPATLSDIDLLSDLINLIICQHIGFDQGYYQTNNEKEKHIMNWIKDCLSSNVKFIFVAEENSKIVGFISGYIKPLLPWFSQKYVGHISYLIIKPNLRRKGVGKLLKNEAICWFKNRNIAYVEVFVNEKNQIGINAWLSYGFTSFNKLLRHKI